MLSSLAAETLEKLRLEAPASLTRGSTSAAYTAGFIRCLIDGEYVGVDPALPPLPEPSMGDATSVALGIFLDDEDSLQRCQRVVI